MDLNCINKTALPAILPTLQVPLRRPIWLTRVFVATGQIGVSTNLSTCCSAPCHRKLRDRWIKASIWTSQPSCSKPTTSVLPPLPFRSRRVAFYSSTIKQEPQEFWNDVLQFRVSQAQSPLLARATRCQKSPPSIRASELGPAVSNP